MVYRSAAKTDPKRRHSPIKFSVLIARPLKAFGQFFLAGGMHFNELLVCVELPRFVEPAEGAAGNTLHKSPPLTIGHDFVNLKPFMASNA